MDFAMNLMCFLVVLSILFFIYKVVVSHKYTSTDEYFSQLGVKVIFAKKSIILKGREFDIQKVTGIKTHQITARSHEVSIEVDDIRRPVYKFTLVGQHATDKFVQRVSTAIRKAGGSGFY